jgi:hypothetical protein
LLAFCNPETFFEKLPEAPKDIFLPKFFSKKKAYAHGDWVSLYLEQTELIIGTKAVELYYLCPLAFLAGHLLTPCNKPFN